MRNNNENNTNFKQKLSSFYDYLERNERTNEDNDDTKSCINMRLNSYHYRHQPQQWQAVSSNNSNNIESISRANSRNVLKLLSQQQENIDSSLCAKSRNEETYNCLFTPRLSSKKKHKDSGYLTWKSFNCNPTLPSFAKETAIISDSSDGVIQNNNTNDYSSSNNNNNNYRFRNNFSNQNLGVIYDESECNASICNDKENFNYPRGGNRILSMSTPGTPLLSSSCTLPRYFLFLFFG